MRTLVYHDGSWIEVDPAQLWFWHPEWQAAERQVDAEIAAGLVRTFNNIDDLIADLDDSSRQQFPTPPSTSTP